MTSAETIGLGITAFTVTGTFMVFCGKIVVRFTELTTSVKSLDVSAREMREDVREAAADMRQIREQVIEHGKELVEHRGRLSKLEFVLDLDDHTGKTIMDTLERRYGPVERRKQLGGGE